MIPSLDEIVRSVVGASFLLRNDPRGMAAFDVSFEGFVKSFFAALVVLPVFAFVHWIQSRELGADAAPIGLAVLAYALQWLAFPLTAAALAKVMNRTPRFVPYVVAANWASVVQMALVLAAVLIGTVIPAELAGFLLLVLTLGLLAYDYLVARIAFETEGLDGAAVVLVQLLVGLLIQHLVAGR